MKLDQLQFCLNVIIWGLVLTLCVYVLVDKPKNYFRYGTESIFNSSRPNSSRPNSSGSKSNLVQKIVTFATEALSTKTTEGSTKTTEGSTLRMDDIFEKESPKDNNQ